MVLSVMVGEIKSLDKLDGGGGALNFFLGPSFCVWLVVYSPPRCTNAWRAANRQATKVTVPAWPRN